MRIFLLALCACLHVIGWGQNIGNLTNTYYKVTNITNKAILTLDVAPNLKRGDRVMVIQMKGASISPSNRKSNTGDVSDANYLGVGSYEVTTVCSVKGNDVVLIYDLSRTYDPLNGKVQLVKVHVFQSGIVDVPLVADPWDGEKGGVLAISVADVLELKANISADGKGFRGGAFVFNDGDCSDRSEDYYDPTPVKTRDFSTGQDIMVQYGAYKGESIVVDQPLQYQGGREAIGNGGGGGNNHNNGGGGGSNLTPGGLGGGNASTYIWACKGNYPGKGGYGLLNKNGERIFLGGGGGAGHGNNTIQTGGGNGGGIVFIEAGTLKCGSYKISANGLEGSSTIGDGASGGGGGGTIILNVGTYSGSVAVEAKGGKGGDENDELNSGRCFGAGGGGSGGAVYLKGAQPAGTISIAGGAEGNRTNTTCPLNYLALPGSVGVITPNYTFSRSTTLSNSCPEGAILPVTIESFKVSHKGPQALAEWKVSRAEDAAQYILQRKTGNESWSDIYSIPAEEHTTAYQKGDGPLAAGIYLYRLKIIEKDHSVVYSTMQQVAIKTDDLNRLLIHPNPATSEITIVAPAAGEEWLNIYDMKSRLVYRKKVTPNDSVIRQDVSFLSEGVYMIQVGKLTARFVVFK